MENASVFTLSYIACLTTDIVIVQVKYDCNCQYIHQILESGSEFTYL